MMTRMMIFAVAAAWWCCCCPVMMPVSAQMSLIDHFKAADIIAGACTALEKGLCVDALPSSASQNCAQLLEAFSCHSVVGDQTVGDQTLGTFRIRDKCHRSCDACPTGQDLQDCVVPPAAAAGRVKINENEFGFGKRFGYIPNLIWAGLTSLEDVDLGVNRLTGMFPSQQKYDMLQPVFTVFIRMLTHSCSHSHTHVD
jgi:hypothetical protein